MAIGDIEEEVLFLATTLSTSHPIILGLPWLSSHGASISATEPRTVTLHKSSPSCRAVPKLTSIVISSIVVDQPQPQEEELPQVEGRLFDPELGDLVETVEVFQIEKEDEIRIIASPVEVEVLAAEADKTFLVDQEIPKEIRDLAWVLSDVEADKLPPHRPSDLHITLQEGKMPPFGRLYSLSEPERKALKKYVEEQLKLNFIRPSASPAAAPVIFVKKKYNNELRLCVDYRGLNAITVKDRFPIPLVTDLVDAVQGSKVFSKIDLKHAYHLIRVAEGDEWKTAFRTPQGLHEYLVMPFGLANAPAAFQRYMELTLRTLLGVSVVCYLDDILVYSKDRRSAVADLRKVLELLGKAGLYARLPKCQFFQEEVEFLGYRINGNSIKMDPAKLSTVRDWPRPRNVRDVQSFIGFLNFYRRFVPGFSSLAAPLTDLTRGSIEFTCSEQQCAFDHFKEVFTSAPFLTIFDPARPCTVVPDASSFALAAVLFQPEGDGRLQPVCYMSRKLRAAEKNYEIYDKELLAIVEAFRAWRAWLVGSPRKIRVRSDHKNLEYFRTTRLLNQRQARWSLFLSDFDFEIEHLAGKKNPADLPSRRADYAEQVDPQSSSVLLKPTLFVTTPPTPLLSSIVAPVGLHPPREGLATIEPDSQAIAELLLKAWPLAKHLQQRFRLQDPDYSLDSTTNFYKYKNKTYIPPSLRSRILFEHHDIAAAGHPGFNYTLELVNREFNWPHISKYVKRYVTSCDLCQRIKLVTHAPYGSLLSPPVPTTNWSSISIDFITKLSPSNDFTCIIVFVDRRSKRAHFITCSEDLNGAEFAQIFMEEVFRLHGLPSQIISDRGKQFVNALFVRLCSLLGITSSPSTAFHQRTNGQAERTIQTLEAYLRCYPDYLQDDWHKWLPMAEFACNNLVNSSTGISPFEADGVIRPRFNFHFDHLKVDAQAETEARRQEQVQAEIDAYSKQLHNVFHISLVEPYRPPHIIPDRARAQTVLEPQITASDSVARVFDSRKRGSGVSYLILRQGDTQYHASWTPCNQLSDNLDAVNKIFAYHTTNPDNPRAPQLSRLETELVQQAQPEEGPTLRQDLDAPLRVRLVCKDGNWRPEQ